MNKIICCILAGLCLCACGNENTNEIGYSGSVYIQEVELPQEKVSYEEERAQYDPEVVIDIFLNLEENIHFSGANGGGRVEISFPEGYYFEQNGYYFIRDEEMEDVLLLSYDNVLIGKIRYVCFEETLRGGDEYRVYTQFNVVNSEDGIAGYWYNDIQEYFANHGYVVPAVEIYYKTPDLGEYYKDAAELSGDILEDMIDYTLLLTCMKYDFDDYDNYAVEFQVKEIYFGELKPLSVVKATRKSHVLVLIEHMNEDGEMEEYVRYYYGAYPGISNIGETYMNWEEADWIENHSAGQDIMTYFEDDYTYEKIVY